MYFSICQECIRFRHNSNLNMSIFTFFIEYSYNRLIFPYSEKNDKILTVSFFVDRNQSGWLTFFLKKLQGARDLTKQMSASRLIFKTSSHWNDTIWFFMTLSGFTLSTTIVFPMSLIWKINPVLRYSTWTENGRTTKLSTCKFPK